MSVGGILNADMGSLRSMAVRGLLWWTGQLEQLLPAGLRHRRRVPHQLVIWDDGAMTVVRKRTTTARLPSAGARVALAVPAALAFQRTLQLPRMSGADLRRLVSLEAERLSPLPASELIVGLEAATGSGPDQTIRVEVAALPQRVAQQALGAAEQAGLAVTSFGLVGISGQHARFDFMPSLRERLLVPTRRSASAVWWSVVAILFLLNLALLVIRDEQSVAQLSEAVDEQAPAVAAARAIQARANDFDLVTRDTIARRRTHDPLGAMAVISTALPAEAWVQRFTADARTVRLTGYRRGTADVGAALRRDPRIAVVRSNAGQIVAPSPAGQPFDLVVQLRSAR